MIPSLSKVSLLQNSAHIQFEVVLLCFSLLWIQAEEEAQPCMPEPASEAELGCFENDLACMAVFTKREQTEF